MKNEFTVVASCGISNSASLNVYEIRYGIDDEILIGLNGEEPIWAPIQTDDNGDTYVEFGGNMFYMGEFIKC